ncbi:hypothetical protein [Tenacibaculum maritimum]
MGEIIYEEKEKKLRQDSQSEEAPLYGCFNIVRELEKYRYCI